MAIIYGRAAAEIDLLSIVPEFVKKIEDVETIHQELKEKLSKTKKDFFDKVPDKIIEEEKILENIRNDEKATHQKFDEKIKILESKKAQGGFSTISASIKISLVKNFSKRREINKIKNLEKKQKERLSEWKENPEQIFNRDKKEQINEVKTFATIEKGSVHKGAKGEMQALKKLSELSDDYHVLCGVRIGLPYWVTYNGKKNLRSAQMDFVVVSTKGVFLVEVKNWSDDYVKNHEKLNPYEQTDRAGRVLWIVLKSVMENIRVTNVLLSIQGNMQYSNNYRAVFVSSLEKINGFLENREDVLSEKEVKKIVDDLKHYVTR